MAHAAWAIAMYRRNEVGLASCTRAHAALNLSSALRDGRYVVLDGEDGEDGDGVPMASGCPAKTTQRSLLGGAVSRVQRDTQHATLTCCAICRASPLKTIAAVNVPPTLSTQCEMRSSRLAAPPDCAAYGTLVCMMYVCALYVCTMGMLYQVHVCTYLRVPMVTRVPFVQGYVCGRRSRRTGKFKLRATKN